MNIKLKPFLKINIFVGKEKETIDGIFNNARKVVYNNFTCSGFGDGIHHSAIEYIIVNALKPIENGCSVFLYVNSLDVINALPQIVRDHGYADDFRLTRIGRSALTSTKGQPIAINYTLDELEASIEMGLETR